MIVRSNKLISVWDRSGLLEMFWEHVVPQDGATEEEAGVDFDAYRGTFVSKNSDSKSILSIAVFSSALAART